MLNLAEHRHTPGGLTNFNLIDICNRVHIKLHGVYCKDELPPKRDRQDGGYIINLQDQEDGNGTHWTAFWVEKGEACYFDSFGVIFPIAVSNFLNGLRTYYNTQQIQSLASGICGYYCVGFLNFMQRQVGGMEPRLRKFGSMFSSDPSKNREILKM